MEKTEADFTMTFKQLREITQSQLQQLNILQQFWALKMISKHELFPVWVSQNLLRLKNNMNESDFERRNRMMTANPRYMLKNWMVESALQKAERNDFQRSIFCKFFSILSRRILQLRKQATPYLLLLGIEIAELTAHRNLEKNNEYFYHWTQHRIINLINT